MKRPSNHVTRELDRRVFSPNAAAGPMPEIPEELLAHLEQLYPPRCYEPMTESLEQHLDYAGRAGFVQDLRAEHERQRAADNAMNDMEDDT